MKHDIFISYSRKDINIADRICEALNRQGISYFIDRKGIGGGQEFPAVLSEAILNCRIMLFLASENSYASKFTNKEITFAFNEKPSGSILPYIIDGSQLPPAQRFTFSDINIRTIDEHPIETVLMQDLCQLLGYEYKTDEQISLEKKKIEEKYKAQFELEYLEALKRREEQYKKALQEEILLKEQQFKEQLQRERERFVSQQTVPTNNVNNQNQEQEKEQEQKQPTETKEETKKETKYDFLLGVAFLIPLILLGVGIWAGRELHSFWLGTEIFLTPSIALFLFTFSLHGWLNDESDNYIGVCLGLFPIIISVSIHAGIYLSSFWWGFCIFIVLLILLLIYLIWKS